MTNLKAAFLGRGVDSGEHFAGGEKFSPNHRKAFVQVFLHLHLVDVDTNITGSTTSPLLPLACVALQTCSGILMAYLLVPRGLT
jgi:hypothetical protein